MLFLSDDALLHVTQRLQRCCLDQLPTTCRAFSRCIRCISEPYVSGILRRVNMYVDQPLTGSINVALMACDPVPGKQACEAHSNDTRVRCFWMWQLNPAIKDCVVTGTWFYQMRPGLIEHFAPLSYRWQNGDIYRHPALFASPDHFTRFFNELAVTTRTLEIRLHAWGRFKYEMSQLWALKAVRSCKRLCLMHLPPEMRVTGAQVLAWLKAPCEHVVRKCIVLAHHVLAVNERHLVEEIKSDFDDSSTRCSFTIELRCLPWYGSNSEVRRSNTLTDEEMVVARDKKGITVIKRNAV